MLGAEAVMKSHEKLNAGRGGRLAHAPRIGQVQSHGLFAENVLPGGRRPERSFKMERVRRSDNNDVDSLGLDRFLE